jgi:hypothetical protein
MRQHKIENDRLTGDAIRVLRTLSDHTTPPDVLKTTLAQASFMGCFGSAAELKKHIDNPRIVYDVDRNKLVVATVEAAPRSLAELGAMAIAPVMKKRFELNATVQRRLPKAPPISSGVHVANLFKKYPSPAARLARLVGVPCVESAQLHQSSEAAMPFDSLVHALQGAHIPFTELIPSAEADPQMHYFATSTRAVGDQQVTIVERTRYTAPFSRKALFVGGAVVGAVYEQQVSLRSTTYFGVDSVWHDYLPRLSGETGELPELVELQTVPGAVVLLGGSITMNQSISPFGRLGAAPRAG